MFRCGLAGKIDGIVETELGAGDIQCIVFILVDGDFENDVLRFRAVALIAVMLNDDNAMEF